MRNNSEKKQNKAGKNGYIFSESGDFLDHDHFVSNSEKPSPHH